MLHSFALFEIYFCVVHLDFSGAVSQPVYSLVYPTRPCRFGGALQG